MYSRVPIVIVHENKLKSKAKTETKKSLSTQFTAVLKVKYEYDTKFWCKLFHSFTELAT